MSITADLLRGTTDTIILAHLLKGPSYGYEINKLIAETTNGLYELKEATLYGAFRRLEEQDLIHSFWGDENTGARRRYYSITAQGKRQYQQNLADWRQAQSLINLLIGGVEQ